MGITAGILLAVSFAGSAFAGQWHNDNGRWWYESNNGGYAANGLFTIDGVQYIFRKDGYLVENEWIEMSNDKWYYCQGGGAVAKNQWVGNYYVGSDGGMLTNAWTPDGYYVGTDGAWVPGYQEYSQNRSDFSYSGAASSHLTNGWIYGFYTNVDQSGFNSGHCVQMHVNYDEEFGSSAKFYFSIYDQAGNNYDLYDTWDPAGDILYGYRLGQSSANLTSSLTGSTYRMTYNGKSTIKIYWRDTSWLDSSENCITLKKVSEYYPDEAYTISVTDDDPGESTGSGPFSDGDYFDVRKNANVHDIGSNDLETADIHRYDW